MHLRLLVLLMIAGASALAFGGKRRDRDTAPAIEPAPTAATLDRKLFPPRLPLDPGPEVPGIVHTSAQVCAACHPTVAVQWATSAHAGGPSAALRDAAEGQAACLGCHLPLTSQVDVGRAGTSFDATLAIEGVTCAACHVRGGSIVSGDAQAAQRPASHPIVYSAALDRSEGCAVCHQLTWPGAPEPLYDTWGEWQRSGFADLSISCLDCHMYGGADGEGAADHRLLLDPARALTLQLSVPTLRVVRGAAATPAKLVLTNTGSGHHFPTGSPYRAVAVEVQLVAPKGTAGAPLLTAELARKISPEPPFATVSDTRIAAGDTRVYEVPISVPLEAPAGEWQLHVRLTRTVRGERTGDAPLVDRVWPIHVE